MSLYINGKYFNSPSVITLLLNPLFITKKNYVRFKNNMILKDSKNS